jgi:23S rRNA (adenine2030-N6)-methyltransferase
LAQSLGCEALVAELWLYPRDSRVGLNGSGLLIVNPPYLLAERMRVWLPELQGQLDAGQAGGTSIRVLAPGSLSG